MVIMGSHLTMQPTLISLEKKNSLEQKHHNIYLWNTSRQFDNVQILLYWFFMLKVKSLLDYTNLLPLNEYEKNDKRILKYFQ